MWLVVNLGGARKGSSFPNSLYEKIKETKMGNLREHEVHSAALLGLGFVPGEVHYLATGSGVPYGFLRDNRKLMASRLHTNILDAYDAVGRQNGNNNVVVVSPDSHSLAAALVLDKNMTHVVGNFPLAGGPAMNGRARLGMSTTFTPMITVSGYGNLFQNLYTMHGTAAGDYIGWLISGARNRFREVHFGGPMIAAQGGHASYNGVHVTGSENYFRDCVFGTSSIDRDELTPNVTLGAATYTVFENCIFTMSIEDTEPYFIAVANTTGNTQAWFKNCQFYAMNANHASAAAVAFTFSGGSTAAMILDPNCSFNNVTKLAVSASMRYIFTPTVFAATADELNLIAINSATF